MTRFSQSDSGAGARRVQMQFWSLRRIKCGTPCIMACIVALSAWVTPVQGGLTIVLDGQPNAQVMLDAASDTPTREAAETLVQYIQRSTGAGLPIIYTGTAESASPPHAVTIWIGRPAHIDAVVLWPKEFGGDGFVIKPLDSRNLVIAGPTNWGTQFGVFAFLERYLGVRWLMPGPLGEDVPLHETLEIPGDQIEEEPAFFCRSISGLRGSWIYGDNWPTRDPDVWALRNRHHEVVAFHHNLYKLFPPRYLKTHPEFYPIHKGERYLPPEPEGKDDIRYIHSWQPCFTADGIVDEAAKNIREYFDQHPDAVSYSLGVNDSAGHCECEKCQALETGEINEFGFRDVSDGYYDWCNRVIERVLVTHPGKVFGCLAYSQVASAPRNVQLHPNLIPVLTHDRMAWLDDDIRESGHRRNEAWEGRASSIGWYEYYNGTPYMLPRVYFHHMADTMRYAHEHGVRVFYAEAYPNWGEGPKLYIAMRLMWDPHQDVDALLDDWYKHAVGEAAAGDLAAYYAQWEGFWTKRIPESAWFKGDYEWLPFNRPEYLDGVEADELAQSRRHLESAVRKAATPMQRLRAQSLLRSFEYYEASVLAYISERRTGLPVTSAAEALTVLADGATAVAMNERRVYLARQVFPHDMLLYHALGFHNYDRIKGDNWGTGLIRHAISSPPVINPLFEDAVLRLSTAHPSQAVRTQATQMLESIKTISGSSNGTNGDHVAGE